MKVIYIFQTVIIFFTYLMAINIPDDFEPKGGFLGVSSHWEGDKGQVVLNVVWDSPAEIAGFLEADIIYRIDGENVISDEIFSYLISRNAPGESIAVTLKRENELIETIVNLGDRKDFRGEMAKGDRSVFRVNSEIYPDITISKDENQQLVENLISEYGIEIDYENLQKAFVSETSNYGGFYKLDIVNYVLRDPIKFSAVIGQFQNELSDRSLLNIVDQSINYLDIDKPLHQQKKLQLFRTRDEHLAQIIDQIEIANYHLGIAFAQLDSRDYAYLLQKTPALLEKFIDDFYIYAGEKEEVQALEKVVNLTKSVNYSELFKAIQIMASFYDPEYLKSLRKALRKSEPQSIVQSDYEHYFGEFIYFEDTKIGKVIIGGKQSNHYLKDAAVIIDLDGDDVYRNNCGGSSYSIKDGMISSMNCPISLVIDFDGDDVYSSDKLTSIGSGFLGVGMLLDLKGDDVYTGDRLTQGTSVLGGGIFIDAAGNDKYISQEIAQGCSFFGLGLLHDAAGDDYYSTTYYAQGFGGTKGIGFLLDVDGDDEYYAFGKYPSGYGTEDIWSGWSQGVGCGFRSTSCGGIGILQDRSGDDLYYGGNFTQGIGYFFALGILNDESGNDIYLGTRYVQGCGVHQAIGCLIEGAGNDQYEGRIAMNQAGAWDVGVGMFLEYDGNDHYLGDAYGQGGAAQNGFVLFRDYLGNDNYICTTKQGLGWGGSNTYHSGRGAKSLVFTIDSDGKDYYNIEGRRNNKKNIHGEWGIFWDQ